MKTVDKYLFQALDNYPYWLEGTIESLDYALSYNDKNVMALCLYGRIQTEQLHDYEEAKRYFPEALAVYIHAVAVYPYYLDALLLNEDYEEASKLIDFALTIKGINKVAVMLRKVFLLEQNEPQFPEVTAFPSLHPQKSVLNLIALSGRPVSLVVPSFALLGVMVSR